MSELIDQIYPPPAKQLPLHGLYLNHNLRRVKEETGEAFVYSNFVASLDGRIAIPHPTKPGMMVPENVANPRDWRLFQELAVQADIIISSGRYLRDYEDGRAQEILQVYDDPQFSDLKDWRIKQGLSPQPDLAVISGSLNFPIPDILTKGDRSVLVFTTESADPERIQAIRKQTGQVVFAGKQSIYGQQLVDRCLELGYRIIYSATGPKVLHLLLAGGVLDRLYLTHVNRILGGQPFSSIVEGDLLEPAVNFRLAEIYHDPHALDGLGQLLKVYDRT